jgi:hypothetical protein
VTVNEQALLSLVLATWSRTAGLTREEASELLGRLLFQDLPTTVDQAWSQLDQVTMDIRRERYHPETGPVKG